ncbi:MAG: hypothetical protein GY759_14210 [Chloroflexi bacterium]|nr:hypothetical protein [Chloroflexota bacterium]
MFKLKPGAKKVHPMALRFPRRRSEELFFPTVHIHHNEIEASADFDHELYAQSKGQINHFQPLSMLRGTWFETRRADTFMDMGRTLDIVDGEGPVVMLRLVGEGDNQDVVIAEEPDLMSLFKRI